MMMHEGRERGNSLTGYKGDFLMIDGITENFILLSGLSNRIEKSNR